MPLPYEKIYKLQIGSKIFEISGCSLSSDSPSFITNYFTSSDKTPTDIFTADRDSTIFNKIYQHLQGYYIEINDEIEYTGLFIDSVFYHLPRLTKILRENENYYFSIGMKHYIVKKTLFKNGLHNSNMATSVGPGNYFEMVYEKIYDGLKEYYEAEHYRSKNDFTNQMRPPPMRPLCLRDRSSEIFDKLLQFFHSSSNDNSFSSLEYHERCALIKECKFYRFQKLQQQLVAKKIIWCPHKMRYQIYMNLQDLQMACVFVDPFDRDILGNKKRKLITPNHETKCVKYKRPYISDTQRDQICELNFQIGNSLALNKFDTTLIPNSCGISNGELFVVDPLQDNNSNGNVDHFLQIIYLKFNIESSNIIIDKLKKLHDKVLHTENDSVKQCMDEHGNTFVLFPCSISPQSHVELEGVHCRTPQDTRENMLFNRFVSQKLITWDKSYPLQGRSWVLSDSSLWSFQYTGDAWTLHCTRLNLAGDLRSFNNSVVF